MPSFHSHIGEYNVCRTLIVQFELDKGSRPLTLKALGAFQLKDMGIRNVIFQGLADTPFLPNLDNAFVEVFQSY